MIQRKNKNQAILGKSFEVGLIPKACKLVLTTKLNPNKLNIKEWNWVKEISIYKIFQNIKNNNQKNDDKI